MRTLSSTLLAAQVAGGKPLYKITLFADTGINIGEALDISETGITCSADATTAIPINSVILIDGELCLVSATGATLTVTRGYGDSDAATHAWTAAKPLPTNIYKKVYEYTTSSIKFIRQPESPDSQTAEVTLSNSDKSLTSLAFKGYKAIIAYGFTTSAGDEYSHIPVLTVLDQEFDSVTLTCVLTLAGIPDLLAQDHASDDYNHPSSSTKTVKTLFSEIADGQPVTEDLTEEQTEYHSDWSLDNVCDAAGQKLLILNRTVKTLSFLLKKVGTPPAGDITFYIRSTNDLSVLAYKVLGDADTKLTTSYAWYTVTFTTPVLINDEVYLECEYTEGTAVNYVKVAYHATSVKADEFMFSLFLQWDEHSLWDCTYKYTYSATGIDVFSLCEPIKVVYDSEDSLIDVYTPCDFFTIAHRETRWAVLTKLLSYTGCEMRAEDDGKLHVFYPGVPLDQGYTTGDNAIVVPFGVNWRAQTFTTQKAHSPTHVSLLIYRIGSPGTVTVSIRAVDGNGQPTGADLCSGTTDGDTLTTNTAGEWRRIAFATPYALVAATKYAIVVRALTATSPLNLLVWRADNSGSYAGGQYEASANSGTTWTAVPTYDLMFKGKGTDYEYSLVSTDHRFYSKSHRDGLIVPNYFTVKSRPDDSPSYSGYYTDAESFASMPKYDSVKMYLASDAQATAIATAHISRLQREKHLGSTIVYMNVGAEAYDYIDITDSRQGDLREGYQFQLERVAGGGQFYMRVTFGRLTTKSIAPVRRRTPAMFQPMHDPNAVVKWGSLDPYLFDLQDDILLLAQKYDELEQSLKRHADSILSTETIYKLIVDTVTPLLNKVVHAEPTRAMNTVYQNTSGKIRLVAVTCVAGALEAGWMIALTDSANPPTTNIAVASLSEDNGIAYQQVFFVVQPDHYYKLVDIGDDFSVQAWHEWDLH